MYCGHSSQTKSNGSIIYLSSAVKYKEEPVVAMSSIKTSTENNLKNSELKYHCENKFR